MNDYQKKAFCEALTAARMFHQHNPTDEKVAETTMRNFNERHLRECATGIGLGGNIRLKYVKSLLNLKALEVQRSQIGSIAHPQQHSTKAQMSIKATPNHQPPVGTSAKTLTKEEIDGLTARQAAAFHLNLSVNNTKPKRLQTLHDYFDKKPAGFKVEM